MTEQEIRLHYGLKIQKLREEKEWSKYMLSKISGVSESNIGRIERGLYDVKIGTLHKLVNSLGKEIDF